MERIATVALLSHLALAGVHAEDRSTNVRMKASGDSLATTISLQDHTITDEENLAGDGALGFFTYHGLRADLDMPQVPDPPLAVRRCFSQSRPERASFDSMMAASWSSTLQAEASASILPRGWPKRRRITRLRAEPDVLNMPPVTLRLSASSPR